MSESKISHYLRSHVLGLVAIFVAFSGTAIAGQGSGGPDPQASASAPITPAKFRKLKQRVAALEGKLNQQATGDLTGIYPNLQIRPAAVSSNELADNAVNTAKLADNAVTTAKLADNAVTTAKIVDGQVRAGDLGPITSETDPGTLDVGGVLETASCDGGGKMLSGGGFWDGTVGGTDVWLNGSYPVSTGTWTAQGNNGSGVSRTLTPYVLCLGA